MQREFNGWDIFDIDREYARLGVRNLPDEFRVVDNSDWGLCSTYPERLVVPAGLSDAELRSVAKYRSKGRLPALSYLHPSTFASLFRCAQPLAGPLGSACPEDQKLFDQIRKANPTNFADIVIIDARPRMAAMGNQLMGRGTENATRYEGCQLEFMNIGHIHDVRSSLEKVIDLCQHEPPLTKSGESQWLPKLEATKWLAFTRLLLSSAARMAYLLEDKGTSCVVHCSDGWDRTSQLSSLCQILLDPWSRTFRGFASLIEKDWLAFGHKFAERIGHGDPKFDNTQRAPVFLQWIESVWQLTRQFPLSFEFNSLFLIEILDHLTSCQFGTFLFECPKERAENQVKLKSVSLWTYLLHADRIDQYRNPVYAPPHLDVDKAAVSRLTSLSGDPLGPAKGGEAAGPSAPPNGCSPGRLRPDCTGKRLIFWEEYYLRWEWDRVPLLKDDDVYTGRTQGPAVAMKAMGKLAVEYKLLRAALEAAGLDEGLLIQMYRDKTLEADAARGRETRAAIEDEAPPTSFSSFVQSAPLSPRPPPKGH